MKITYTAPNRSHHYPYAESLFRAGHLHAFVSGFSRYSPRAAIPSIGFRLKRHDFFQNFYLASLKFNASNKIQSALNKWSNTSLDRASYKWAKNSDVFIFYRTQGVHTTRLIRKNKLSTTCVLEEVNSHIDAYTEIMATELKKLKLNSSEKVVDYSLRLKAYEESDHILCPSEFVRKSFLSRGFPPEKIIKVNFGFPSNKLNDPAKTKSKTFRVLYVGQLHYRKGLRYAIQAFSQLKNKNKEFVIVGPKTAITGLETSKIPEGVIFTGPLKGRALEEEYMKASVFLLPSLEEGLALVQGEALSYGVPLLITSNTGGEDIITNGVEGFIVPPANSDELANKLQWMCDDKKLLESMSNAAFKTAKLLGSWDSAAERLVGELRNRIQH